MTTPNPLAKTKGAGTTFWMYTGNGVSANDIRQ